MKRFVFKPAAARRDPSARRQRELLEAWTDGYLWGILYRAALWVTEEGAVSPPMLADLKAAGDDRYAEVLRTVARWRRNEVWAIVLWEQSDEFGGGVYFSVESYDE